MKGRSSRGGPRRLRLMVLAGGALVVALGLLSPALVQAAAQDEAAPRLTVRCEDNGFRVLGDGSFLVETTTVESFLTVNKAPEASAHHTVEPGVVFVSRISSGLLTGSGEHHVSWAFDGAVVAEGKFSHADACASPVAADPSPTPTLTGSPSPVPSASVTPQPTSSPGSTNPPQPTSSPTPTGEPTASPPQMPSPTAPSEEVPPREDPVAPPSSVVETPTPAPTVASRAPSVTLSSASVPAASSVSVRAGGFDPGERIELWLHSVPWKLADATADANGELALTVGIAGGTDIGSHRIEVRGARSGSAWADVEVTDDLAITGIDSAFASGVATTGLVLVLGGVTVMLLGRRAARE